MLKVSHLGFALTAVLASSLAIAAPGWDENTNAGNISTNGIADTRHNLTMNYASGSDLSATMNTARNNYGEVCVYCHTPHGADTNNGAMPLWNRTTPNTTYQTWDRATMLGSFQEVTAPAAASLTCLSCHDGITAIDSVINMPGSGKYDAGQASSENFTFLESWDGAGGGHADLTSCRDACHDGSAFAGPDFSAFIIGADLTDDHPVGVKYPQTFGIGVDFNDTDVKIPNRFAFFDLDNDQKADKNEIRVYDTAGGGNYEVECASCHDPHGVPGNDGKFIPSFLRVDNADASALCLTCHVK